MPTIVERVSNARAKVRAGARPLTRAEEKTRRLNLTKTLRNYEPRVA